MNLGLHTGRRTFSNTYRLRGTLLATSREEYLGQLLLAADELVAGPRHDALEDVLLRLHVQLVVGEDVGELRHRQEQELLRVQYLLTPQISVEVDLWPSGTNLKIVENVFVRDFEQIPTAVRVGECADSQAVGGVELLLQEFAADVLQQVAFSKSQLLGGIADSDDRKAL